MRCKAMNFIWFFVGQIVHTLENNDYKKERYCWIGAVTNNKTVKSFQIGPKYYKTTIHERI